MKQVVMVCLLLAAVSVFAADSNGMLSGDQPTRIDVGAAANYTAPDGTVWLADRGFAGGLTLDRGAIAVTGTKNAPLFRTERYKMGNYTFKVPNGSYMVKLYMAETFNGITAAGQRVFDVDINGLKISGIDIFAEAKGANSAIVKSVEVEVKNGTLTINFTAKVENAKLDALEIIPEWWKSPEYDRQS
jgi:endoglucanase